MRDEIDTQLNLTGTPLGLGARKRLRKVHGARAGESLVCKEHWTGAFGCQAPLTVDQASVRMLKCDARQIHHPWSL